MVHVKEEFGCMVVRLGGCEEEWQGRWMCVISLGDEQMKAKLGIKSIIQVLYCNV